MKTSVALLLCVLSVAAALPFNFFQNGQATGNAGANVVSGSSSGPFQNSRITQNSAFAGGSTRGNALSQNSASGRQSSSSGFFGNHQSSQTSANSNQKSFGNNFGNFGGQHFF